MLVLSPVGTVLVIVIEHTFQSGKELVVHIVVALLTKIPGRERARVRANPQRTCMSSTVIPLEVGCWKLNVGR